MPNPRTLAAFAHDLCAAISAWLLAYALRFNFKIPAEYLGAAMQSLAWVVPIFSVLFYRAGLYRGLWRFASMADLQHLATAILIGSALTGACVVFFGINYIPRSVLILYPVLLVGLMGGSRFAYRSWKEHSLYGPAKMRGQPVLVVGTGEATDSLLRELDRSGVWYAVAVVSDAPEADGQRLRGLPVFAPISRITDLAGKFGAQHIIIAMPEAQPAERREITELAASAGLTVLTVPAYSDLLSGRFTVSNIRRVELEDLLGRDKVTLDNDGLHQLLANRHILVSGAGGSIGSELCRQIAMYQPAKLILVDSAEFSLYAMDEELASCFPGMPRQCWAADVRDKERIDEILCAERPAVVFHAAAYKHVPLMESVNAWQAVRTNALGTLTMARAAAEAGVEKFVQISTDKAVNPTSVMGASKRLAERLCRSLQDSTGTRFTTVRFGNVLGSNGSVIPKFREQIARGGPVTVTHPEIVRYFMTIPEAAQLVLQAGLMGHGGEIFVLDMGQAVKITDLARNMILLSGYSESEIKIEFSGLRPGEKLYEELLANTETTLPTPHPKLRIARLDEAFPAEQLAVIENWLAARQKESSAVKIELQKYVPEYLPTPNNP